MLAFACAFTMFAGAAFTDQADINADNADAVELLTALNVIQGDPDGSFAPEREVTRAEMAKMIYVIRNGGNDNADAYKTVSTSFTDISGHWAEGYIKYLQNTGIVAGKSATQFDPDSQVTTGEAMKMALALAGYDEVNAGLTGTAWLNNTVSLATTYGLTDDVASAISGGCSRQDAAQILANALGMTAVRWSSVVENFVNDSESGLSYGGQAISVGRKWMDLWTSVGTLTEIDGQDLNILPTSSDRADSDKDDDGDVITSFIRVGTDYSDLMGQKVKVLFEDGKNNSVIGVYAVPDNEVVIANQKDVSADGARVRIDGTSYTLDDELSVSIDGTPSNRAYTSSDFVDEDSADVLSFIDSDDDGRIDFVYWKNVDVVKVTYATSSQIVAGGNTYRAADHSIAEDIANGDWVIITANLYNDNKDIVAAEMAEGSVEVTRGTSPRQFCIDGEWYNVNADENADISNSVREGVDAEYVAVNGVIFYASRITGTDTLQDVLFVTSLTTSGTRAEVMYPNGATDEIRVATNSVNVEPGNFYEYTVSGSTYRLYAIDTATDAYGDYSAVVNVGGNAMAKDDVDDVVGGDPSEVIRTSASNGNNYITDYNGYKLNSNDQTVATLFEIDDDADVIIYDGEDGTATPATTRAKHITGKQLKALAITTYGLDDSIGYGAFYSGVRDNDKVTVVALEYTGNDFEDDFSNLTTYANYGFITGVVGNVRGFVQFYMWNGSENILVTSDSNDDTNLVEGAIVGYDALETDEDGNYTLVNASAVTATAGYISWTDGSDFTLRDQNGAVINLMDSVGDAGTVLYVDTTENSKTTMDDGTKCFVGVTDGEVVESADKDNRVVNALWVADDLLVIDVSGAMNGVNADSVIDTDNTTYTHTVNLSNVNRSDFRSFQLINKYTGETYNNNFVAYNSVYEIHYDALASGTIYVDTNDDGTADITRSYTANTNTREDESLIIPVPVMDNVTISTATTTAAPDFTFTSDDEAAVDYNGTYRVIGNNILIGLNIGDTVKSFRWSVTSDNIELQTGEWKQNDAASITTDANNVEAGRDFTVRIYDIAFDLSSEAGVQDALDVPGAVVTLGEAPATAIDVDVPTGATLVITNNAAANMPVNSSVTVANNGEVVVGNRTYVGEGGLESTGAITLTLLSDNRMSYALTAPATLAGTLELAEGDQISGHFAITGANTEAEIICYGGWTQGKNNGAQNEWIVNGNNWLKAGFDYSWDGSTWTPVVHS